MSADQIRDVLERIVQPYRSLSPRSRPAAVREAMDLLDAVAPIAYEYRAAAGDAYDSIEDYSGWTDDEQLARARVGSLDASPAYALQWLERRTPERIERIP